MTSGRPLTTALGIAILAMLALTVLPAQQRETTTAARPSATSLTSLDYIEIQQLVRKSAWALDSGDNYGYAYADLFTPDGAFVGTNQGTEGRTIRAATSWPPSRAEEHAAHTVQSHFTMNHVVKASGDGATGRAYVVVVDVGVVGKPNQREPRWLLRRRVSETPQGWRFKRRTYYESKVDVWPASVPRPGQ